MLFRNANITHVVECAGRVLGAECGAATFSNDGPGTETEEEWGGALSHADAPRRGRKVVKRKKEKVMPRTEDQALSSMPPESGDPVAPGDLPPADSNARSVSHRTRSPSPIDEMLDA